MHLKKHLLKSLINFLLFSFLIILLQSCGKGISPLPPQEAGFSGTITFKGTWPDSIQRTHLVIFKNPLLSSSDFSALNLRYVSLEIPYGITQYHINSLDSAYVPIGGHIAPGEYSYVCVAQSKTPQLSLNRKDWFVVGVFYSLGDTTKPGKLIIPENTFIKDINIVCDFNHPPPQPPGGN